ncbi:gamma-interferon-inducible lysosomal thiol reductase isoform X1 [Halyomorpha halys]|uniref:gamma-interferon-inducible lysosomal thiol reductase isoform X1 n=1 Tax=Halyomorpha halys TaxID=286706 RepID=UPI0006D516A3
MLVTKCLRIRIVVFLLLFTFFFISFFYILKSPTEVDHFHNSGVVVTNVGSAYLQITVYYECLCPDSRSFFVQQLLPSVEKVPNLLKIDYVPYGKAETEMNNDSYEFSCQHGPQECLGNKIHSCVIKRISNELTRTRVLTCMIGGKFNPEESGRKCSRDYNLDWNTISQCAEGKEGNELLKLNGDKTNALSPEVSFIPTILLNNERNNQAAILKDLWKQICLKFKQVIRSFWEPLVFAALRAASLSTFISSSSSVQKEMSIISEQCTS